METLLILLTLANEETALPSIWCPRGAPPMGGRQVDSAVHMSKDAKQMVVPSGYAPW
jgi:hypothetical protein